MARYPDWFDRLDAIQEVLTQVENLEWLGRNEIKAIFNCSERDSIRLLHKLGAENRNDALCLTRSALLLQLDAIRQTPTYAAFLRQRNQVAERLAAARAETRARHLAIPVRKEANSSTPQLETLPETITWRRSQPTGAARFEIVYRDGFDLMSQLAEFLSAAGVNREEFFAGTEPHDGPGQ